MSAVASGICARICKKYDPNDKLVQTYKRIDTTYKHKEYDEQGNLRALYNSINDKKKRRILQFS